VGVEGPEHEEVDGEPDEAEREAAERPSRVAASAAVYEPCCRTAPTMARRSTKISAPAGSVSSATSRVPSDACRQNDALSRRATERAISGTKVVAIDTASSPWGRTKNVNAWKYAVASPDPGSARLRTTTIVTWLAMT
jgi:hypothetical protein